MNGYAVLRILASKLAGAVLLVLLPSLGARAQQRDGSAFQVNTYTTGAQGSAQVARQPDGAFMVVWESDGQDGSLSSTFARMFASDGSALGDDFPINAYTTGRQVHPSVVATADGEFVVVWSSWDQSALYGQRFGPTGSRIGTEFRVDTDGVDALHPRVVASPRGSFVVVWQSWYTDGRGLVSP